MQQTNTTKASARNTYPVGPWFRSKKSEQIRDKNTKGDCFCDQWVTKKA